MRKYVISKVHQISGNLNAIDLWFGIGKFSLLLCCYSTLKSPLLYT